MVYLRLSSKVESIEKGVEYRYEKARCRIKSSQIICLRTRARYTNDFFLYGNPNLTKVGLILSPKAPIDTSQLVFDKMPAAPPAQRRQSSRKTFNGGVDRVLLRKKSRNYM